MSNYITAAKINLMYILCFIDSFLLLIFREQVYFSVDAACFKHGSRVMRARLCGNVEYGAALYFKEPGWRIGGPES